MHMILYSEFAEEAVRSSLEGIGVAGYTQLAKVTGRGPRGQHFDTYVWRLAPTPIPPGVRTAGTAPRLPKNQAVR
jgi:hypothetical protein